MTSETLETQTEVIEAPPVEAVTPAPEAVETPQESETAEQEKPQEQPRDEKGRFEGVQKRIDELTRARREAEREAEYWRNRAMGPAGDDDGEPSRDTFADDASYYRELARFEARRAAREAQSEQARDAAQTADERAAAARMEAWKAREAEVVTKLPDYDAVVRNSDVPVEQHVVQALLDSDAGPQLAYHLAKNPQEAARLNAMPPLRAAIELGRLEAALTATPVKAPSNAPDPMSPLAGAPTMTRDPNKMSPGEYREWRKQQGLV